MSTIKQARLGALSPEWALARNPFIGAGALTNVSFDATTAVNAIAHPHGGSQRWIHCDMSGVSLGSVTIGESNWDSGGLPSGLTRRGFLRRCFSVLENTATARTQLWEVDGYRLSRNTDDTCRLVWAYDGTPQTFDSTELLPVDEAFDLRLWYIDKDAAGNTLSLAQVVVEVIETIGASQTKRTILNERVDTALSLASGVQHKWKLGEDADRGCDYYAAGLYAAWEEAGDPSKIMRGVWAVPSAVSATYDAWTLSAGADKVVAVSDTPGETETTDFLRSGAVSSSGPNNVRQGHQLPNSLVGASDVVAFLSIYQRWRQFSGDKQAGSVIPEIFDGTNILTSNFPGNSVWSDTTWHDQYSDLGVPRVFLTAADGGAWSPTGLDNTEIIAKAAVPTSPMLTGTFDLTYHRALVAYEADGDVAVDPPDLPATSLPIAGRSALRTRNRR